MLLLRIKIFQIHITIMKKISILVLITSFQYYPEDSIMEIGAIVSLVLFCSIIVGSILWTRTVVKNHDLDYNK